MRYFQLLLTIAHIFPGFRTISLHSQPSTCRTRDSVESNVRRYFLHLILSNKTSRHCPNCGTNKQSNQAVGTFDTGLVIFFPRNRRRLKFFADFWGFTVVSQFADMFGATSTFNFGQPQAVQQPVVQPQQSVQQLIQVDFFQSFNNIAP